MSDENNDDLTQILLRVVEASEETNKLLPQVKQAFSLADRAGDIIRDTRRNEEEERAKIKHLEKASYNLGSFPTKVPKAT